MLIYSKPVLAIQNNLPRESIAIGNSMMVFTQNFGGTVFLSFAELIFSHTLSTSMASDAPGIEVQDILSWGATGFRDHVARDDLPGVLVAYNKATTVTFYLGTAAAAVACIGSSALGWKSVKKPAVISKA